MNEHSQCNAKQTTVPTLTLRRSVSGTVPYVRRDTVLYVRQSVRYDVNCLQSTDDVKHPTIELLRANGVSDVHVYSGHVISGFEAVPTVGLHRNRSPFIHILAI